MDACRESSPAAADTKPTIDFAAPSPISQRTSISCWLIAKALFIRMRGNIWRNAMDGAGRSGASDESAHLMVQMMESWFLADRDCLARYFGNGFNANALPAPQKAIEDISKEDLERALDESPRQSSKRRYAKGRDSFALLGQIDAAKVIVASPHARRLVEAMSGVLANPAP